MLIRKLLLYSILGLLGAAPIIVRSKRHRTPLNHIVTHLPYIETTDGNNICQQKNTFWNDKSLRYIAEFSHVSN
jgi:hypothetical protein